MAEAKLMDTAITPDGDPTKTKAEEWPQEVIIPPPGVVINGKFMMGKHLLSKDEFAFIRWQLTYKAKHDLFVTRDQGPGASEHATVLNGGGR